MTMVECSHPNDNHTVWWWIENTRDPVLAPYSAHFDTRDEAMWWVLHTIEDGVHRSVRWMKVFRSRNDMEVCYDWSNSEPCDPEPEFEIETKKTKLLVGAGEKPKRWWQLRR